MVWVCVERRQKERKRWKEGRQGWIPKKKRFERKAFVRIWKLMGDMSEIASRSNTEMKEGGCKFKVG
jgi:hypothetical protein